LASIDAFLELAASEVAPKPALRNSLRRLGTAGTPTFDWHATGQRALILVGIAVLHVLLLFALREAMRTPLIARGVESMPFQVTFIEPHRVLAASQPIIGAHPVRRLGAVPQRRTQALRTAPRKDALQAVTIVPPAPVEITSTGALLYNIDGSLRLPPASTRAPSRDLLAHQSMVGLLPRIGHEGSSSLRVHPITPQEIVEGIGAHWVYRKPSGELALTGGGHFDPCPDIENDMLNQDDAGVREDAERRYEKSCEGR
jgi:hypothetical protein